jgi:mRNA interferase RelE/StbE
MSNEQTFRIALSKDALKYYNKVSTATAARLDKCFINLESEPFRGPDVKPLKGLNGKYRYRIGKLRILYEIDSNKRIVYILAILPRGQAYKS